MNDNQRVRTRNDMEAGIYSPAERSEKPKDIEKPEPQLARKRPGTDSTITVTEKKAFDQIFENIRKRSITKPKEDDVDSFDDEVDSFDDDSTGESLQDILSGAVQDQRIAQSHDRRKPPSNVQDAVKLFPKALQTNASKALSVRAAATRIQEGTKADADRWESIRKPERERVETLMRSASSDLKLWAIMESEVFSMIGRLGLNSGLESNATNVSRSGSSTKSGRRKMDATDLQLEALRKATETPVKPALDINVYGPLYPAYLLLGLRLLNRSFARPSPLVQTILPRIKALGLASHALGGSTALYNELLRIAWQRHDDLPTVFALLQEMESAGLGFNADTRDIIREMISMQSRAQKSEENRTLHNFYSMPTFKNAKMLKTWKNKCEELIRQKALDFEQDLEWETKAKGAEG